MGRRLRDGRAALVGAVLGVGLIGGGAYAATGMSSSRRISACVSAHGGTLYRAGSCRRGDRRISWGTVGPQGPQGPQGPAGPQGPSGTSGTGAVHYGGIADAGQGDTLPTFGSLTLALTCNEVSGNLYAGWSLFGTGGDWSVHGDYGVFQGTSPISGFPPTPTSQLHPIIDGGTDTTGGVPHQFMDDGLSSGQPAFLSGEFDVTLVSASSTADYEAHFNIWTEPDRRLCSGEVTLYRASAG